MRVLLFSTLFPNAAMPAHGIFVANRIEAFRKEHDAEVKVIAPVPWFPFRHGVFGAYGDWAGAPEKEMRGDIEVFHPRYLIPPKAAMRFAPAALTRCLRRAAGKLIDDGWDFDLIDAHYLYPDGVAAAWVARELDKPLVITARGTDVNLIPAFAGPRRAIVDAARRADAVVTVAAALKEALVGIGAPGEKITVLRNGVDLDRFHETDREMARRALGLEGLVLASVGHLIGRKGHDLVIEALPGLPNATLLIVGDGPERASLAALARRLGVADRVTFLGRAPHEELADIYSAADMLVLASSREGWPNVLLEAMACGTPCIATNVWGSGEVIRSSRVGRLLDERSPRAIVKAVKSLSQDPPGRRAVRSYAEGYSWKETADGMARIFADLTEKSRARGAVKTSAVEFHNENFRPQMIVTVDTEEQFDWREFEKVEYAINDTDGVDRFQALCAERGAQPIYFLTWPFLSDSETASYFQRLRQEGAAECGLHLHQWATPPGEWRGEFYSFQKNLPRATHLEKLRSLAEAFERVFGKKAKAHRAGRYGIALEDYELLNEIGIEFDFSPSAAFDFSARGGSDFSHMSNRPFGVTGESWRIFVTPVCGAKALRRTRMFLNQERAAPGFAPCRRDRLKACTIPMRLSPEGAALPDLKALTRKLVAARTPVLTFTLHSTSLCPGGNVYATDRADVDRLLQDTAAYFDWFTDEIGGRLISLTDLGALYRSQGSAAPRR